MANLLGSGAMDLLLWRHAEAEDGDDDLKRRLTARGEKQARTMATWITCHRSTVTDARMRRLPFCAPNHRYDSSPGAF